jgi:hypothetical protein
VAAVHGGSKCNLSATKEIRCLRLAAADTRGSLRRLAVKIPGAGNDPQRQAQALATAQRISRTYAYILRLALENWPRVGVAGR